MGYDHITFYHTLPELDQRLREAHEDRAAAFYAAWRAGVRVLGAPFRGLAEAIRRTRRARRTYHELAALSDAQLNDIGLSRGEIRGIAEAVAAAPPAARLTLADLRGAGTGPDRGTVSLPPRDGRQRQRPAPWQARRPAERERAAG